MDTMYINNTNLARRIRENNFETQKVKNSSKNKSTTINSAKYEVFVGRTRGDDAKDVYVIAWITDTSADFSLKPFDTFDFLVLDAIYTLYHDGYKKFSLHDVLRVITYNEKVALTPKRREHIKSSIDKMIPLKIAIDAQREGVMRKKEPEKYNILKQFNDFLPITRLTDADVDNAKYVINNNLPIFEYAENINRQIITIPKILVVCDDKAPKEVKKELLNTIDVVLLKRYIISRIEIMRNRRNKLGERRIRYESMLDNMGVVRENYGSETAFLHKCRVLHNKTLVLLEYFKIIGYIEDFKISTLALGDISGVEVKGKISDPKGL